MFYYSVSEFFILLGIHLVRACKSPYIILQKRTRRHRSWLQVISEIWKLLNRKTGVSNLSQRAPVTEKGI